MEVRTCSTCPATSRMRKTRCRVAFGNRLAYTSIHVELPNSVRAFGTIMRSPAPIYQTHLAVLHGIGRECEVQLWVSAAEEGATLPEQYRDDADRQLVDHV